MSRGAVEQTNATSNASALVAQNVTYATRGGAAPGSRHASQQARAAATTASAHRAMQTAWVTADAPNVVENTSPLPRAASALPAMTTWCGQSPGSARRIGSACAARTSSPRAIAPVSSPPTVATPAHIAAPRSTRRGAPFATAMPAAISNGPIPATYSKLSDATGGAVKSPTITASASGGGSLVLT